jgi:cytochrome P450
VTIQKLDALTAVNSNYGDDLFPVLDAEREKHAITASSRGYEVFRYDEVQALLRDRRLETDQMSAVRAMGIPPGPVYDYKSRWLLSVQGERRIKLRKPLSRFLAPSRVEGMTQTIEEITNHLFDALDPREPSELMDAVCKRLPAELFCDWIDAPRSDAPFVARMSDEVFRVFERDPAVRDRVLCAYDELFAYADGLIEQRRGNLGDDLLSDLLRLEQAGEFTALEVRDYVMMTLEGSTDNTAAQIGTMLGLLLEHPNQWQRLVADPSLIPRAVEESIRFRSRILVHIRKAITPTVIAGVDIPADAFLFMWVWSAHRDERVFDAPTKFDIARERRRGPIMFGGGQYSCLGQHLAHKEMEAVLRYLVERYPRMTLAEPVEWWRSWLFSGLLSLRVTLEP